MTLETTFKKTIGWIFMLLGAGMILFIIIQTYSYFTGGAPFPELFYVSASESTGSSSDTMSAMMEEMLSSQLNSFISKESITLLLNMTAFSLLAFFMVFAGGKLFELGLKAIKD